MYGASDEDGIDVKTNPVTEGDFFATIYQALGIDPKTENYAGPRPIPPAPLGVGSSPRGPTGDWRRASRTRPDPPNHPTNSFTTSDPNGASGIGRRPA